jgi:hypothetical protein
LFEVTTLSNVVFNSGVNAETKPKSEKTQVVNIQILINKVENSEKWIEIRGNPKRGWLVWIVKNWNQRLKLYDD